MEEIVQGFTFQVVDWDLVLDSTFNCTDITLLQGVVETNYDEPVFCISTVLVLVSFVDYLPSIVKGIVRDYFVQGFNSCLLNLFRG